MVDSISSTVVTLAKAAELKALMILQISVRVLTQPYLPSCPEKTLTSCVII